MAHPIYFIQLKTEALDLVNWLAITQKVTRRHSVSYQYGLLHYYLQTSTFKRGLVKKLSGETLDLPSFFGHQGLSIFSCQQLLSQCINIFGHFLCTQSTQIIFGFLLQNWKLRALVNHPINLLQNCRTGEFSTLLFIFGKLTVHVSHK